MWSAWMRLVIWASLGLVCSPVPATTSELTTLPLAEQNLNVIPTQSSTFATLEMLIVPIPTVVKLIGQMVIFSSRVDVNFENQKPVTGWKHITNPRSLRASLVQVGHQGWKAFLEAQGNMEYIALKMAIIPDHVKTALDIIGLDDMPFEATTDFLSSPLEAIQLTGEKCVAKAEETTKAFNAMTELTFELIEAVTAQRGFTDTDLKNKEIEAKQQKLLKKLMKEQQAKLEKKHDELQRLADRTQAEYQTALNKIPTGFEAFFMDLGMAVIPAVASAATTAAIGAATGGLSLVGMATTGGGSGLLNILGGGKKGRGKKGRGKKGRGKQKGRGKKGGGLGGGKNVAGVLNILGGLGDAGDEDSIIMQMMEKLSQRLPEFKTNIKGKSGKGLHNRRDFFSAMSTLFDTTATLFKNNFPGTDTKVKAQKAVNVVTKLSRDMEQRLKGDQNELSESVKTELLDKLEKADRDFKAIVSADILRGDTEVKPEGGGGDAGGGSSSAGANERFIAASLLERLKFEETRLDNAFEKVMEFNERLTAVEVELEKIELETVDLEKVRELLTVVLQILTQLRDLWTNIVIFFKTVANQAKVINEDYLKGFVTMAEIAGRRVALSKGKNRQVFVKLLKNKAFHIQKLAHLLETMTALYVRISDRHILKKLSGLADLLNADTLAKQEMRFLKLDMDAEKSKAAIKELIEVQKKESRAKLCEKQKLLSTAIAKLGAMTREEEKAIEEGKLLAGTGKWRNKSGFCSTAGV